MTGAPATMLPYGEEHELVRATAKRFFESECAPHQESWETTGMAPPEIWRRAGELGLLCPRIEEEHGGLGGDFLYSVVLTEEQVRAGVTAPVMSLHSDVVAPYLAHYGTEAQKAEILPKMISGEAVGAIGMTEPGAGSDLRGMRMTARRDGDAYILDGQKTFISNGASAGVIITAAKTDEGISLFIVETDDLPGFSHGEPLKKLGQRSADVAELFFDDVRVPADRLLGGVEGQGFRQMVERLVEERLLTGMVAVGMMERAIDHAVAYTQGRMAFGKRIIDFQNSRFKLAEAETNARVARIFLERCILKFIDGRLDESEAAMLKWWTTDLQGKIVDDCLQLFGGYGYMLEYPISNMWLDSRVARIYGGANEVMKEIIGRTL